GDEYRSIFLKLERVLQVAIAQRHLFLHQEIRDARRQLQSGGEGNRSHGIVWCYDGVICLRHPGDDPAFGDATGMAKVRLKDAGGTFFQDLTKAPLREYSFARGDG